MSLFVYDGSFEGVLTSIFDIFATKAVPLDIVTEQLYQPSLLDEVRSVQTDAVKAERVLKGIDTRSDNKGAALVYKLFLSELPKIELHIYRLVHLLIENNNPAILDNFANEQVLYTAQVNKMIDREVHRMHAFVRFKKSSNGIYFAVISPDFNVLPLLGEHFARRFADQHWVIFDARRNCALVYDLHVATFLERQSPELIAAANLLVVNGADNTEDAWQHLWKKYFQSVNIGARKNTQLHLRHMPRRYWKYLIEKQVL
jgi:probable DNA metabolism protein